MGLTILYSILIKGFSSIIDIGTRGIMTKYGSVEIFGEYTFF